MRRPTLRIVEYRHSATAKYVIEGVRVNGKRQRKFFATLAEAMFGRFFFLRQPELNGQLRL
jgi:hypothetical protein